ncbi:MAG: hypothetical protein R6X25_00660 [Candidatus Krumholzibacteriia bacterium]
METGRSRPPIVSATDLRNRPGDVVAAGLFVVLAAALLIVVTHSLAGCSDDEVTAPPATLRGQLVAATECKIFPAVEDPRQECLHLNYDGAGTLALRHENTAFNCCPKYTAEVTVTGGVITVVEVETAADCDCVCLYDLDYRVEDLTPGEYMVYVEANYLQPGDVPAGGRVALDGPTTLSLCEDRDRYPW